VGQDSGPSEGGVAPILVIRRRRLETGVIFKETLVSGIELRVKIVKPVKIFLGIGKELGDAGIFTLMGPAAQTAEVDGDI